MPHYRLLTMVPKMHTLLTLVTVVLSHGIIQARLNLLNDPSFEKGGGWDLWERTSLWDVRPANGSIKISKENPHKGSSSLLLSPPRDADLQAVIASQYVAVTNASIVHPTSLKVSFQVAGEDTKHMKAILAISYADGRHMMAEFGAKDYAINEDEEADYVEVCGFIPAYGQIRAVMLHLVLDREARTEVHLDSIRLLPNQPMGKTCVLHTSNFPQSRQTFSNFLTPPQQPTGQGITLATQLTVDRWSQLKTIAERWQGPVSASILVFQGDGESALRDLTESYKKSTILGAYVSVHLVFEDTLNGQDSSRYPANYLRNVALSNARTSHAFLIDADITPIFSEEAVWQSVQKANAGWDEGTLLAVIAPLFHSVDPKATSFPETKEDLLQELKGSSLEAMNVVSHSAVKYNKWKVNVRPYEIPYIENMEPYFVVSTDTPLLNEMFTGYGRDKCAYSKELNRAGYRFIVLPDVYLINKREHPKTPTIINRTPKGGSRVDLQVFLNAAFHEKDMEHGYIKYPARRSSGHPSLSISDGPKLEQTDKDDQRESHCDADGCDDSSTHKHDNTNMYSNPTVETDEMSAKSSGPQSRPTQSLDSDDGLGCDHILINEDIFKETKLPVHPMGQKHISTLIEFLSKAFGTWTLVSYPGSSLKYVYHLLILYHPDAIISLTPEHQEEKRVVDGVTEEYYTKSSVYEALGNVTADHPQNTYLFHIRSGDLTIKDYLRYITDTLQRATDKDIVLIERDDPRLVVVHRYMCEVHPTWKMYRNGNLVLLKSSDLTQAPPPEIRYPPLIVAESQLPPCAPETTRTDLILMTKNRPLQTLAFLESLHKMVKHLNKVWIVQRADEQGFKDGYAKVVQCMSNELNIEVLEQQKDPIGDVVLEALTRSEAEYAMFGVDEMVWTNQVDLNEVTCLLNNSGDPTTSFHLRLGDNLQAPISNQQRARQFETLKSNKNVYMFYPLHLEYDFGYVLHVDAMVMRRDAIVEDLKQELPGEHAPGTIEASWLIRHLHTRCRQWHFMYKQSRFVNNMGYADDRVATASKPSHASFQLLDVLMTKGKKVDVDQFIRDNKNKITYTHFKFPVIYKDWVC